MNTTTKSLAALIGIALAILGLMMTAHAAFVVPAVMHQVSKEIDKKIESHSNRPHEGIITRPEWLLLLQHIKSMDDRLGKLESKL